MTFSGLNVTFGFIQASAQEPVSPAPIYGPSTGSKSFTAAGDTGTILAQANSKLNFIPAVFLTAQVTDWWVTIGPSPADPSVDSPTGGRHLILAAELNKQIFCNPGDKVRVSPVA